MAKIEERTGITVREGFRRFVRHENGVLVIIVLAMIAGLGGITRGLFVTRQNAINIILQCSTRGVAAIGQSFVILTGGIDLSTGGLALMTMILGASLMTGTTAVPVVPMAIMLLVGAGVGASTGSAVSRIGMPALIVTLAWWQIADGIAYNICQGRTIGNLPAFISFVGAGRVGGVPIPVIIFIVTAVVAYFVLHYSTFGRSVYAAGGNPVSAWLAGVNVKNIMFFVYVISGFLAALAGMIILGRIDCASMAAATGLELDSIAAVVIGGVSLMGGRGTIIGAVLGTIILGMINNGMNMMGMPPAFQSIVKGVVIFIAVAIDYLRRRR
jgi:ribose/xylose/arabinose/galactoside ABC-type transport system permease subunit